MKKLVKWCKGTKAAFIGKYAKQPRYQGGGSSHINSFKVESALEMVWDRENITYADGYDDTEDVIDENMLAEAVKAAKSAEIAVIFAGLPDNFESEGYDRKHLRMPDCQNRLIEEIAKVQPNVVVVLHNGAPIEMPWIDKVKAVLEVYLGGQAVGGATADILYGKTNPSGRLPETFPLRLSDTPCYLYYGGENDESEYREGVFTGYRYYTSKDMKTLFPFGHGLSYTSFAYEKLTLAKKEIKESEEICVSVDITNVGNMTGKEVVQLYVSPRGGKVIRPVRELRAFDKIELRPGETKTVNFRLNSRAFSYWNMAIHDWHVETGDYEIQIGKNASEIILSETIHVESEKLIPKEYTLNSTVGDILSDPKGAVIFQKAMGSMLSSPEVMQMEEGSDGGGMMNSEMLSAMLEGMPLRQMMSFIPGVKKEDLMNLVKLLKTEEDNYE